VHREGRGRELDAEEEKVPWIALARNNSSLNVKKVRRKKIKKELKREDQRGHQSSDAAVESENGILDRKKAVGTQRKHSCFPHIRKKISETQGVGNEGKGTRESTGFSFDFLRGRPLLDCDSVKFGGKRGEGGGRIWERDRPSESDSSGDGNHL